MCRRFSVAVVGLPRLLPLARFFLIGSYLPEVAVLRPAFPLVWFLPFLPTLAPGVRAESFGVLGGSTRSGAPLLSRALVAPFCLFVVFELAVKGTARFCAARLQIIRYASGFQRVNVRVTP